MEDTNNEKIKAKEESEESKKPHVVTYKDDKVWFEEHFPDFSSQQEMMHEVRMTAERIMTLEGVQKQRQNINKISRFLDAVKDITCTMGVEFENQESLIHSEYQSQIDSFSKTLQEKESEITRLKEITVSLNEEKKLQSIEIDKGKKELGECHEKIGVLRSALSSRESENKVLQDSLTDTKDLLKASGEAVNHAEKARLTAETKLAETTKAYDEILEREQRLEHEVSTLNKQLSEKEAAHKKEVAYLSERHSAEIKTIEKQAAADLIATVADAVQAERDAARKREISFLEKIEHLQNTLSEKDVLINEKTAVVTSLEHKLSTQK